MQANTAKQRHKIFKNMIKNVSDINSKMTSALSTKQKLKQSTRYFFTYVDNK